jgi:O-acetyl-ADP-ribose deacetylase (regulator of RNase III)
VSSRTERWTNASALLLAAGGDPVEVTARARATVLQALDAGWSGPPFDPIALAAHLKLPVTARHDIPDARTVPVGGKAVQIEFNPSRPPARVRYSIAHEIAHTLFPDCAAHVRNRAAYHELKGDEWQLEALCNIAAAEILMPAGSLPPIETHDRTVEQLMDLRKKYEVSAEALLIHVTRVAQDRCAMFCASQTTQGSRTGRYRLDYIIRSQGWHESVGRGLVLPENSCVGECVAIGFTSRRTEQWTERTSVHIECVAIPPYPGDIRPRVVGLLTPGGVHSVEQKPLQYVKGDATEPRGDGPRILAHIVNDATPNWGGGGFAQAVRRKWPTVQDDFQGWVSTHRNAFTLGEVRFLEVDEGTTVASMIAQHGYGASARPRIRYGSLAACLRVVGMAAAEGGASVHMPRIGTGQAGGNWDIIQGMVLQELCARDVHVTVYDPPNREISAAAQTSLFAFK